MVLVARMTHIPPGSPAAAMSVIVDLSLLGAPRCRRCDWARERQRGRAAIHADWPKVQALKNKNIPHMMLHCHFLR